MHRNVDEPAVMIHTEITILVGEGGWKAFCCWDNAWDSGLKLVSGHPSAWSGVWGSNGSGMLGMQPMFGLAELTGRANGVGTVDDGRGNINRPFRIQEVSSSKPRWLSR